MNYLKLRLIFIFSRMKISEALINDKINDIYLLDIISLLNMKKYLIFEIEKTDTKNNFLN